jgi:hypothetical protein
MRLNKRIVLNRSLVREERRDGKNYLIAPVSMLVPGVLRGSDGSLLYPSGEIARTVDSWKGVPIVVNHPTDRFGNAVSAQAPGVLDRFGVGFVSRTNFKNGKLVGEGWFDIEKTRRIDYRIENAIRTGKPMELSTGLFTKKRPSAGTFNGRDYTHIATNYRPDHLAILPDKRGACSLDDGCGLNVNKRKRESSPLIVPSLNDDPSPGSSCSCFSKPYHEHHDGSHGVAVGSLPPPRMSF